MRITIIVILIAFNQSIFSQKISESKKAPKLNFTHWFDNETNTLDLKDKPIILEFWASWCAPCLKEIPHMNSLSKKYSSKITFISVNSFETKEQIKKIMTTEDFSTFVVMDENKEILNSLKIGTIPAAILIDSKNQIRWRGNSEKLTEELIETFLTSDEIILSRNQKYTFKKQIIPIQDNKTHPLKYSLEFQASDLTKSKAINFDYDNGFSLMFQNMNYKDVIEIIHNELGSNNDFVWEGNIPNELSLNLLSTSEDKDSEQLFLNDIINQLSKKLNFSIYTIQTKNTVMNQITFH